MEFYNLPTNVVLDMGCVVQQSDLFSDFGEEALILSGKNSAVLSGALADVICALENKGIHFSIYDKITINPLISVCKKAGDFARLKRATFIVAIGGGSVIDAAKATAIFATNNNISTDDLLNLKWENPPLPIIAIGITAGTGSEVTDIAVLTDDKDNKKKSISKEDIYPKVTFADYEYTKSMNYETTVSTALDGLCHALEGYFSKNCDKQTDIYTFQAVKNYVAQLKRLSKNSNVISTESFRKNVHNASIMAGITLNSCKTAFPHLLGYLLTENCNIPHGFACSAFITNYVAISIFENKERAALTDNAEFTYPDLFNIIKHFNDEYFNKKKDKILCLTPEIIEKNTERFLNSKNRINSPSSPDVSDLFNFIYDFIKIYSD
ncbi:MAG: iron-containing alcohol dehydrogenase [Oscillospiraceae bacterium]